MLFRVVLVALATVGAGFGAEADFGLIGLTALENARLNAYCDGSVVPTPCEIVLTFRHIGGRTLKQTTLTLEPGTGGFLDLSAAQTGLGGTVQIDPCWKVLRGAGFASLEIFDTISQRTRLLASWSDRSVARSGDIDFAFAGITPFDTARVGAFCEGDGSVTPSPCEVTFEFHDASGRTVKQTQVTLQPETGGYADLRWSDLVAPTGRRAEINPCFKVLRGNVIASFSIVDNLTGLTLTQAYPAALARAEE
jgi:hypothetical protein